MVPTGTRLTFTARGTTEAAQFQLIFTPGMLESGASEILSRLVDVTGFRVTSPDTIVTGTLPWSYRADVELVTRTAHARVEDVAAIVANAIYQASGRMPTTITPGRELDFEPPELSWKVVIALATVAVLIVIVKVA